MSQVLARPHVSPEMCPLWAPLEAATYMWEDMYLIKVSWKSFISRSSMGLEKVACQREISSGFMEKWAST